MYKAEPFYPNVNRKYVYLTSLATEQDAEVRQLFGDARAAISLSRQSFLSGGAWKSAFDNLKILIDQERRAEINFLSDRLGLKLEEVEQYGFKKLIDSFNKILNIESTYATNISRVKAMLADGNLKNKTGQIDYIYSVVNYTLPEAVGKAIMSTIFSGEQEEQINKFNQLGTGGKIDAEILQAAAQAIEQALLKIYGTEGRAYKDYEEFSKLIQALLAQGSQSGSFIDTILKGYGVEPEKLKQNIEAQKEKIRNGKSKKITGKSLLLKKQGGVMFEKFREEVYKQVASCFNGNTISTGSLNNMKADQMIMIGFNTNVEAQLRERIQGEFGLGEASVRLKNIQGLEKFFNDVKDTKGNIVFVSDKNYRLNSQSFAEEKGFAAETPSFEVLEKVLGKTTMSPLDLDDLIFVLANSGPQRINQEYSEIQRYLATTIGNFVFDDVVITKELSSQVSSINRIHIFDLGGILIPLSVFLEATHDALSNIQTDYTQFVNVKISPGELDYKEQTDGLTESDWSQLYEQSVKKGHVAFHFFGNFINFVRQWL